ncbi:uncharacterized protein METZ01_LOCUS45375, partial [marine metagenome]
VEPIGSSSKNLLVNVVRWSAKTKPSDQKSEGFPCSSDTPYRKGIGGRVLVTVEVWSSGPMGVPTLEHRILLRQPRNEHGALDYNSGYIKF